MAVQTLDQYIERTAGVMGGKPRLAGRRVRVQDVVVWHEWLGLSADDIATNYDLTLAEIYAALAYYFDNPREVDAALRQGETLVAEMKARIPSKLHGSVTFY